MDDRVGGSIDKTWACLSSFVVLPSVLPRLRSSAPSCRQNRGQEGAGDADLSLEHVACAAKILLSAMLTRPRGIALSVILNMPKLYLSSGFWLEFWKGTDDTGWSNCCWLF